MTPLCHVSRGVVRAYSSWGSSLTAALWSSSCSVGLNRQTTVLHMGLFLALLFFSELALLFWRMTKQAKTSVLTRSRVQTDLAESQEHESSFVWQWETETLDGGWSYHPYYCARFLPACRIRWHTNVFQDCFETNTCLLTSEHVIPSHRRVFIHLHQYSIIGPGQ